ADATAATWTVDGLPGVVRLVDGGDVGDTYNWCPPDGDVEIDQPDGPGTVRVLESGPLRGRLEVAGTWRDGAIRATTVLELRAGEAFVRVTTTIDNRARDHRLRVHIPLAEAASHSDAECAFAVVRRGLEAEGGPTELGLPTFPSRRFVRAGGITVAHEGLLEYELVDIAGECASAATMAVTLLRCTGLLSQRPMATRALPAGPIQALEGPQLQKVLTVRWALAVGEVDPYALVDDAFLPLEVAPGGAPVGQTGPAAGSALTVTGAEVSAVRRTPGGSLEVRVFNPTAEATMVSVPGRSGWVVDLLGRPQQPFDEQIELGAWKLATLQLR
ncbi:MAG: alpha-mannosidase, partial [Actinomycetota bacterium]|nr:alpha-mannosidase [Actinomycetota bacterium]